MKERPILFSGEMVRAILDGRKTQTRRVVKAKGHIAVLQQSCGPMVLENYDHKTNSGKLVRYQYGVAGDRLWVRETFRQGYPTTAYSSGIVYRADAEKSLGMDEYSERHKWKPSIFMPRYASRITLEIVKVRVERLNAINAGDAEAEGCGCGVNDETGGPVARYSKLWESINGAGSWAKNPWVWVIEFKKL